MQKKGIAQRLLSLSLVFTLVLSLCAFYVQSAFADDEPAPIQDTYEVDGVTYFKIDSDAFETSPAQYQLDMLRTDIPGFRFPTSYGSHFQYFAPCIGDLWLYLGAGIFREHDPYDGVYLARATALEKALTGQSEPVTIDGKRINAKRVLRVSNAGSIQNFYSPEGAEKAVYREIFGNESLQSSKGYFKGKDNSETVLAGAAYAETDGENNSRVGVAAYFSDFKIIALIPEDKDGNYIEKKTKTVTEADNIIASNVKNLTASNVTTSQSISRSQTDTVSSTVNGSKSHTLSKGVEVGFEQGISAIGFKFHGKVSANVSDVVSSGWSNSESKSMTETTNQSVSVNLAPYTNVMLRQHAVTEEWVTRYNCPVALQYTATIVLYNSDGSIIKAAQFGPDAREDLYKRAVEDKNLNDKNGVNWKFFYDDGDYHVTLAAVEKAASIVPMSSTGGAFTETIDTMESDIYSLLPVYPLYKVKVRAPNVSYISDETYSYGSYNYLNTDMYIGDFSYTNYMALEGLNQFNVDYYRFSKDFGHWVVADKEGNEWTGDDAPVVIEKDPVSKNTMYKAVRPGVCYIKFVIDEDVYNTADKPDVFTRNSDLYQTAAVRINVKENPFKGTINVGGSFTGKLNDEPRQLDAEGQMTVDICDETGKEIVKPYVWEAKELASKGINIDGNMASFTKAGKFHVRAVSGDLRSDWVEIEVTEPECVHAEEVLPAKAATCTETGLTEGRKCSLCGEILLAQEEIPALGHDYKAVEGTAKAATSNEEGKEADQKCSRCGDVKPGAVIAKLDPAEEQTPEPTEEQKAVAAAREELNKAIDEAKNVKPCNYTDESFKALQDAIAEAEALAKEENATKAQLDAAAAKIADAKAALKGKEPAAGTEVVYSSNTYAVTSEPGAAEKTVAFTKAKNAKTVTVPSTMKINGETYKVTSVAAKAFKDSKCTTAYIGANVRKLDKYAFRNSKVRTVIVKSKSLSKARVKGSLKYSKVKTVKAKVSTKKSINRKYAKKFKSYFKKSNTGRKVTVKY